MPLILPTLENGIKSLLEADFKKPAVKESLRKQIDGGRDDGNKTSAKTLKVAYDNIKTRSKSIGSNTADTGKATDSEEEIKKIAANEHANAIADAVCEWLSKEIAPIIAKNIASEVDKYIKSATIIIPPGQVLYAADSAGGGPGSTTAPSPPALIS